MVARAWGHAARSLALGLVLLSISAGAAADDHPVRPLSDSLTGQAHTDYEVGLVLFKDDDFAGALAKFEAAYDKAKEPRLLYNVAACERSLHHYARTMRLLIRYKEEAADELTEDDRKEANDVLAALRQYVAPLRVNVPEADASVFVDDEFVGKTPLATPVLVDFGKITLRVTKPGFAEYREPLEVKDQGEIVKTVGLERPEGRLIVTSRDDATIDIDGKFVSRGRLVATLSFGGHQLKVTAPGYRAYQTEVIVERKERSLDITLEKEKGAGLPLWVWIGGSALLVAGVSIGSYFIYRAATAEYPVELGTVGGVQVQGFHW